MAIKVNADVKRGKEILLVWPQEIIADPALNGREEPHSEEVILNRVESYKRVGQLTPVTVRKVADKKLQLVAGYCRHAAMLKYNELHPEAPMRLKCIVEDLNDEEALKNNIIENMEREEVTPLDHAFNQRTLRDRYGWTDGKIAEFYHCTVAYIYQLKKLLILPADVRRLVRTKELSVQNALAMADLDAEAQREILVDMLPTVPTSIAEEKQNGEVQEEIPNSEHSESNGEATTEDPVKEEEKVEEKETPKEKKKRSSAVVTEKIRNKMIAQGKKGPPRTLANVKSFLESMTGPAEKEVLSSLAEILLDFIAGRTTEDHCARCILQVCEKEEVPFIPEE